MAKEKEKDEDEKGKEPEIVIVTDDAKDLEAIQGPQTDDEELPRKPREKVKDEPPPEGDDEDEGEEDSRLGASEEMEAEAEAKEKAKASHKSRRQRQKEAERRLRTERDFLERRNEAVEKELQALKKRLDTTDRSALEGRISYTKTQIAKAERIHADAIAAQKGEEATEALKIRDNLRESLRGMEERKTSFEREEREPPAAPRPEIIANARGWMGRTKWYDPQLRDQDSKIVRALDIAVEEAGFDPATPEYFEELDRRIAEVLPHRAGKKAKKRDDADDEDIEDDEDEDERPAKRRKAAGNGARRPSGGPRFRTGGSGRDLKANEVFLTPERIAALKEVGAWDDPVLRQKYLKKYQAWDAANPRE